MSSIGSAASWTPTASPWPPPPVAESSSPRPRTSHPSPPVTAISPRTPYPSIDGDPRAFEPISWHPPATSSPAESACCPCTLHEARGEWSRFFYYLGRKRQDGSVPLRVVRSLLLDEPVLCSNRVSQMTKTYNDIEAVTRLLEEKEKDLELTARIGKELLAHNQKLEASQISLEGELRTCNDKLTQLTHEFVKKTELIQILTNDVDESGSEAGTPSGSRCINMDVLERRIGSLEKENRLLRTEASQLANDTTDCEQAEQQLLKDVALQLANANFEVDGMADELSRTKEERDRYAEELRYTKERLTDSEIRLIKLSAEHEELSSILSITRDNQNKLAGELSEFKERYAEISTLLSDTQEQLKRQRRRTQPHVRAGLFPSLGSATQPDSLASELESSLYSEMSLDSGLGLHPTDQSSMMNKSNSSSSNSSYRKVFETVRCASRGSNPGTPSRHSSLGSYVTYSSSPFSSTTSTSSFARGSMMTSVVPSGGPRLCTDTFSGSSSGNSSIGYRPPFEHQRPLLLDSTGHSDGESSSMQTDTEDSIPPSGNTQIFNNKSIEAALNRLTPGEVLARRAALTSGNYGEEPPHTPPYGCRTPDSIMSTGSSGLSGLSGFTNNSGWKFPEKLQIVKPIEGSLTLAAWSQLAQPSLSGLLDDRPGVRTRGAKPLDELGLELYSLSDLEEDDASNPGKRFQSTGSIYTYTNCTVLHPEEQTLVTSSLRGSQMCPSTGNIATPMASVPGTPAGHPSRSRRGSTSTFSTTLGLAKMLNERGIMAATPSALNTPARWVSPTATPCNSPDRTPPGSPAPGRSLSTSMAHSSVLSSSLLAIGTDLFRRTFSAETAAERKKHRSTKRAKYALSRSERKALSGIRLVETLERIGFDTLMASTTAAGGASPSFAPGSGALYARRNIKSPMEQLTSLKSKPPLTAAPPQSPATPPPPSQLPISARGNGGPLGRHRRGQATVRPDLGTLPTRPSSSDPAAETVASTLGTISSLLFGRKGGLL